MKKLIIILAIALVACSKKQDPTPKQIPSQPSAQQQEKIIYAKGKWLCFNGDSGYVSKCKDTILTMSYGTVVGTVFSNKTLTGILFNIAWEAERYYNIRPPVQNDKGFVGGDAAYSYKFSDSTGYYSYRKIINGGEGTIYKRRYIKAVFKANGVEYITLPSDSIYKYKAMEKYLYSYIKFEKIKCTNNATLSMLL